MSETTTRVLPPTVYVSLPVPDSIFAKNSRAHHMERHAEFQRHKLWACLRVQEQMQSHDSFPWPASRMTVIWRYSRGVHPDIDNAVARLGPYLDGAEQAGLVANDRHIQLGTLTFDRVPTGREQVELIFQRVTVDSAAPLGAAEEAT